MREKLETAVSVLLGLAAIALAAVLIHREFGQPEAARPEQGRPRYVSEWRDFLAVGHVIGDTAAPVKLIEFVDLECPFCRLFHKSLTESLKTHGSRVAYVFIHFPLPNHRFARPAARAVECANAQGRLKTMLDVVFEKQDSLGLKSWVSYARDSGVRDTTQFAHCVADTVPLPIVEAGLSLAERNQFNSTPTILVNGWLYRGAPTAERIDQAIRRLLEGKEPL